jgi:predicted aldo/keto reductase-like oxidoreductase
MPGHMMQYRDGRIEGIGYLANETIESPEQIFEDQLNRCGVDYFDFYLLHNVCEIAYDFYTNEELGVVDYLLGRKKAGRIRHFGFSAHVRPETIEKFLKWSDSRFPGGCFEIAQIQLNYLDWTLQNSKRKYEILTEHGLPVVAMEPCRGGMLASFDEKVNALFKAARPNDSIASWAFRYLKSLPNVQVTLSGMSSLEQLKDNLQTFSEPSPITDQENAVLQKVVASLVDLIPCTGCRYCSEECPQKLDIPKLISMYNEIKNGDASVWGLLNFTLGAMTEAEMPVSCSDCGNCKQVCPQGIDVPDLMKKLDEAIDKNGKRKS